MVVGDITMNTKALPKTINKPIIIFVLSDSGETIYLLDPTKKTLSFIYTLEDGVFDSEDTIDAKAVASFRKTTMRWHWIASGKIKGAKLSYPAGKILHWEYL
jgi:hypothetical protein